MQINLGRESLREWDEKIEIAGADSGPARAPLKGILVEEQTPAADNDQVVEQAALVQVLDLAMGASQQNWSMSISARNFMPGWIWLRPRF